MKRRIVSLLLAVVMLLGIIPGGAFSMPQAEAAEAGADGIKIDFEELAQDIKDESWWKELAIGTRDTNAPSDEQNAQYDALLEHLAENYDWTINETVSKLKSTTHPKQVILNTDAQKDWALRYYTAWLGNNDTIMQRNNMQLDLTVSEEDAGWYQMDVEAFMEGTNSTQATGGIQAGSGYAIIKVNGHTALEETAFSGSNVVSTITAGYVELKAGVNTITIHNTKDVFAGLGHGRRSICLNNISFTPVETADGPLDSIRMDFKAFARKAAAQPWWEELIATNYDDIKIIGSASKTDNMSDTELAAYQQMLSFLSENECWSINETVSKFSTPAAIKRLVVDNSENACGLRYYPIYFCNQVSGSNSKLAFEVKVPLGAQGEYYMDLSVLHEHHLGGMTQVGGMDPGAGYADIYVNGTLVWDDYDFASRTGKNYSSTDTLGVVELQAGINTVTIDMVKDYNSTQNSKRRALSLNAIEFRSVQAQEQEAAARYDFSKASELTAEDGFEAIERYEDLNVDDVASALWRFAEKAADARANYDLEEETAVLQGNAVSFVLDVTESGWITPKLDFYRQTDGGVVHVYLAPEGEDQTADAYLLAELDTYGPEKKQYIQPLRPVYLEAGQYTLTFALSGTSFWWNSLSLYAMEQPTLELYAGGVAEKQDRPVQTEVTALWNGSVMESLTGANWSVEVSEEEALRAEILPATAEETATLQITGLIPGEYEVAVSATIGDVTASVAVPVTVKAPAQLESLDVTVPGVVKQTARATVQKFVYNMIGADGEAILPAEAEITYETDVEGIIEIDEETHTFRTLQNGDVTVTITAAAGGVSLTDVIALTVADVGENCLIYTDPTFETEDSLSHWMTSAPGTNAFNFTERVDDGTGNMAMKISVNPEASHTSTSGAGTEIRINNGYFAKLEPGHMYEMSARIKTENYKKAAGSMGDLFLAFQMYDYLDNARVDSQIVQQVLVSQNVSLDLGKWTEVRFVVRAPLTTQGPVYIMPRIVMRPSLGVDYAVSGWEATAWFDDITIREVGFERVELELSSSLTDTVTPADLIIKPVTTSGDYVDMGAEQIRELVTLESTNEDVVEIVSEPVRTRYTTTSQEYFPTASVRLVGLNAPAELVAAVNIHGITLEGRMDMTTEGMPEVLRDISYTLDGFEAAVLKNGEIAEGILTGRTTQLTAITEEQLREGAVYFVSSAADVAAVDQLTGDVTCVGEGTATITAYALMDGVTVSDSVTLTVTDDTDLVSVEVTAAAEYVGVNNTLQLSVSGKKASGGAADMSRYPVAWSIDEEAEASGIASIDRKGRLTGHQPGTVTVTATVGVMRTPVTDKITVSVVENTALAGADVLLDFSDGHLMNIHECTLDNDGVEINRDETYNGGKDAKTVAKYGFGFYAPVGSGLVFDFIVERDGWYRVEAGGGLYSAGNISDIFVDDSYAGTIDFHAGKNGAPYSASCIGNTIYLQAGEHTFRVIAVTAGYQYLGKLQLRAATDPNPITVTVTAEKDSILVGESTNLVVTAADAGGRAYSLKSVAALASYENHYMVYPVTNTVSASGNAITGQKPGYALVDIIVDLNGSTSYESVELTVEEGTIASADLTAEATTLEPGGGSCELEVVCYDIAGGIMELPAGTTVSYDSSAPEIASVSEDGVVTAGTVQGSAKITATITEGSRSVQASVWFTITTGKTEPTIYTNEERAIAQENVLKYSWAWDEKETAVAKADYIIENLDAYYNAWIREGLPRTSAVYREGYPDARLCDYCGENIETQFGVYGWMVDPIENPWKITCPYCMRSFPSNDFGAYYASGLDERGYFDASRADESLLVNTSFPDKPSDWGVDDGSGWLTGDVGSNGVADVYNYIAYYVHMVFTPRGSQAVNGMDNALSMLTNAYVYTGEEKYGSAGAILLSRMAEIYPEYDLSLYSNALYANSDGSSGQGKLTGAIWEGDGIAPVLARAADAFWPCMNNDDVVQYLRNDAVFYGVEPEQITPEYLRQQVDEGILLEIRDACLTMKNAGNFGMEQESMALAAVALDRLPETEEMIDWTFRYGERLSANGYHVTGANVLYNLVNLVDRNGYGNEVSYTYNRLWYMNLMGVADALDGYTGVEGADLWQNAKFVDMFRGFGRNIQGGRLIAQVGEAGTIQSANEVLSLDVDYFLKAYQKTGDPFIAQMVYAGNGNSVEGLHADIFTKDPEGGIRAQIQAEINAHGEMNLGESGQLAGFGMTLLRKGPAKFLGADVNADEYFTTLIYYGLTGSGHGQLETLALDLFGFGLELTSNLGYPTVVNAGSAERMQWVRNTVSHNTVVVDDEGQLELPYGAFPKHFDDAGMVQLVDVDGSNAYAQTDIYRRTLVTVEAPNGVPYTVDFFRVLGGSEHVYSFHANGDTDPDTMGLDFIHQPMGTYAGPDVPYGDQVLNQSNRDPAYNQGSGYSWLENVYRDAEPDTAFTVDWKIEDFHDQLASFEGVHMKLTMLSQEPMTEVALADGHPPQNGTNPETLKYLLVRRSGEDGMDTLFTSVIEPYQFTQQIVTSQLVDVKLVSGTEGVQDKAAAIKVTLTDGREDYIVYATNPACTYEVDGRFAFRGFVGVCAYYDDILVYAYGNEAANVADAVKDALPEVTGEVLAFTQGLSMDGYTITVSLDQAVKAAELEGRCIYVANDGQRNAVYQIRSAEVNGDTAVLNIDHETLVRSYLDGSDLESGYIYNIAEGQRYTIPLSHAYDLVSLFNYTADTIVKTGSKLTLTTGVTGSGATYKAENLVTGMKFNSTTGVLTWTPSRTQTGRYPITVTAYDADGKELGTMSFVIYAVSYTGSTYDASVCSHSKAVTYTVGNVIETVCPACKTVIKETVEQEIEKFDVVGTSMSLDNALIMNFMVDVNDLDTTKTYTARITHGDETVEQELRRYNSLYWSVSHTVAAAEMADTVTVEVYDEDGNAVSNVYEKSVRDYAMGMLTRSGSAAELKTLCVDLLNYGAAAQKHFGVNTDDLANKELTEAQKALGTQEITYTNKQVKGKNFVGTTLSLEENIQIKMFFSGVTEGMYAKVSYTGLKETENYRVEYSDFVSYGNYLGVYVDTVVPADATALITVTMYNADGTVYGEVTDSIESYCARSGQSELNDAIMKFAASAKAFLG